MAIVNSVAEIGGLEVNGSRHVVERHTDHTGQTYMRAYFAPPGLDINVNMASYVPALESQLAEMELERLLNGG